MVPALIADEGDHAARRFLEFFTANIRNKNTRAAYARAVGQFLAWCGEHGLTLRQVEPMLVGAYIEQLQATHAAPTVKQHLAAVRMFFDWMVTGQVLDANPATSVRGPKHIVKKGKTHVLNADDARTLLDSIEIEKEDPSRTSKQPVLIGLRDRALIAVMVFSFARISAVLGMKVDDYYPNGKRWWLRLHEKGGKFHEVPAHHLVEAYLDAYIQAAKIRDERQGAPVPLRPGHVGPTHRPAPQPPERLGHGQAPGQGRRRQRPDLQSHLPGHRASRSICRTRARSRRPSTSPPTSRPKTTKLYDRTSDAIDLGEIEKIVI